MNKTYIFQNYQSFNKYILNEFEKDDLNIENFRLIINHSFFITTLYHSKKLLLFNYHIEPLLYLRIIFNFLTFKREYLKAKNTFTS